MLSARQGRLGILHLASEALSRCVTARFTKPDARSIRRRHSRENLKFLRVESAFAPISCGRPPSRSQTILNMMACPSLYFSRPSIQHWNGWRESNLWRRRGKLSRSDAWPVPRSAGNDIAAEKTAPKIYTGRRPRRSESAPKVGIMKVSIAAAIRTPFNYVLPFHA